MGDTDGGLWFMDREESKMRKKAECFHGGDCYGKNVLTDHSINVNPLGMTDAMRSAAILGIEAAGAYPDILHRDLTAAVSEHVREILKTEKCCEDSMPDIDGCMVFGNGAAELLHAAVRYEKPDRVYIASPGFYEYRAAAEQAGAELITIPLKEAEELRLTEAVPRILDRLIRDHRAFPEQKSLLIICNPNNPNGSSLGRQQLLRLWETVEETGSAMLTDESFLPFFYDFRERTLLPFCFREAAAARTARLYVLHSFTKIYGMPGLRLGCLFTDEASAGAVRKLLPPWNVNIPAEKAGIAALKDEGLLRRTRELIHQEREKMVSALCVMPGISHVYPGHPDCNFILFRTEDTALAEKLLAEGILIRDCSDYEDLLPGTFRIAVRTEQENKGLIRAIEACLRTETETAETAEAEESAEADCRRSRQDGRSRQERENEALCLMIQGTMSNAGKSLIAAGLCRIFHEDGFRTAPFKAQNMALNSYVTADGREMGRAQAVQAEAAGIRPEALMNPILLKPATDVGSQVIVNGFPVKNMTAQQYYKEKNGLRQTVTNAYHRLASRFDMLVIEGAGSPAEINLRQNDFVNMGMAKIADAPVILVGDIDRGGVFAQLYGTYMLLLPEERDRLIGFIINKFRGDPEILEPGIRELELKTGKPVLGTIPYMDVRIEDEDSLSLQEKHHQSGKNGGPVIAVIRFPHISNFTDFAPLEQGPAELRFLTAADMLPEADLIILPGTKNTISDMKWLMETGMAAGIMKAHAAGTPLIGICGGYQMLCDSIEDPDGTETEAGCRIRGLGLLDGKTVLGRVKQQRPVTARRLPETRDGFFGFASEMIVSGYEIHMGTGTDTSAFGEQVFGTYLHGIFENDDFRRALLQALCGRKAIDADWETDVSYEELKERQFCKLAAILREQLDIPALIRAVKHSREKQSAAER